MAKNDDILTIRGSDNSINTFQQIDKKEMQSIYKNLMQQNKIGNLAEVTFMVSNSDSSFIIQGPENAGISASSTLTGVNKTEIVNNNITLQNKYAASIKNIKSFAAKIGAIQAAKTVANYAISNYGNWTQDPLAQAKIDNAMVVAGTATNIATATLVGGIYGFVSAVVAEGINYTLSGINRHIELKRKNIDSQLQYTRAGITARNSGGR